MQSAVMLAVLVCTAVTTVVADYREAFRRGVLAARRNQWPVVVQSMRESIAEKPADTDERINIAGGGGDLVAYTPYYYLGLGLYYIKDCGGALAAWQTSETQGGLKRVSSGDRNNVAKFRKDCEGRVAAAAAAAAPKSATPAPPAKPAGPDPAAINAAITNAEKEIERAADGERLTGQLSTDPMLSKVWRSESFGPAEQRAREALATARNELDTGRRESNLQRLQQAALAATSAALGFETVRQTATTRREQLIAEAKSKPTIDERPATPPAPTPTPATPPVAATAKPEPAKPVAPAANPAAQPFTPPAPLAAAARLFFRSQYQEAAASLARLRYDSGPEAGHAALLRAATQYSLYLVGGERDSKLLDEARRGVTEVRRLAPNLRPDPKAFSPRFVEFFASVR